MKNLTYPVGPCALFVSSMVCASMLWLVGCDCGCLGDASESARASATTPERPAQSAAHSEPVEGIVIGIDRKVDGDADMTLLQPAATISASAAR